MSKQGIIRTPLNLYGCRSWKTHGTHESGKKSVSTRLVEHMWVESRFDKNPVLTMFHLKKDPEVLSRKNLSFAPLFLYWSQLICWHWSWNLVEDDFVWWGSSVFVAAQPPLLLDLQLTSCLLPSTASITCILLETKMLLSLKNSTFFCEINPYPRACYDAQIFLLLKMREGPRIQSIYYVQNRKLW